MDEGKGRRGDVGNPNEEVRLILGAIWTAYYGSLGKKENIHSKKVSSQINRLYQCRLRV